MYIFSSDIKIYQSWDVKLKRIDRIDPGSLKRYVPHLKMDILASLSENFAGGDIFNRFEERFGCVSAMDLFLSEEMSRTEELELKRRLELIKKLDVNNFRALSKEFDRFLTQLMRVSGPKGIYAQLNALVCVKQPPNTDCDTGYLMRFQPHGVLVDKACLIWCVLMLDKIGSGSIGILSISEHILKELLPNKLKRKPKIFRF